MWQEQGQRADPGSREPLREPRRGQGWEENQIAQHPQGQGIREFLEGGTKCHIKGRRLTI